MRATSTPPAEDPDYYGLLRRATLAAAEAASMRDAVQSCLGPLSAEVGWSIAHVVATSREDPDRWISVGTWLHPEETRLQALRGVLEGASGTGRVGPAARAAETGVPQWQLHLTPPPPDAREATFHPLEVAADLGLGAALAFPVLLQGSVVAVVEVFTATPTSPDPRVVDLMDTVTRLLAGVAERQGARLAAQAKDEQLRRLLGTTAALVTVDPRGAVEWSSQLQRLLGWSYEEAMRRDIVELLLVPGDTEEWGPALRELVEQAPGAGRPGHLALPVRHRDGRVLSAEISVSTAAHGRTTLLLRDVTERRNAQHVMQAVNDTMRRAFVDAPIGMAVMSRDGDFLDVNSSLCRMLGYDRSQLTALTIQQVTDTADIAATVEHLRQLKLGTVTSFRTESACRHQNGQPLRAIIHVSAVLGSDGSAQYLVAQFEDVTERHRLEVELRKERAFLDAVLENLDTGIVACDADGSLTLFNRASREFHGVPSDAPLVPEQWAVRYDLFHGDGKTPMRLTDIPLFRALSGERVRNAEMVIAPENRAPVTIVSNAERLLNPDGTVLGAVATMHDVTARRRAEAALVHQARHDTLTGLANRRQLRDRLGDALHLSRRNGDSSVRLLLLDLDGFKTVNDALGHHAGDRLLEKVSDRVVGCLRSTDTAARLGGDEFAILLPSTTSDDALHVAERILSRLSEPFDIDGVTVTVGASVGIADAAGVADVDALLRNADLAMYQAKAAGKGRVAHYEPRMHEALLARLAMERDLRTALQEAQFSLQYQPVHDLQSGEVVAVEALLRWNHPDAGVIPPAQFVPLAETTGLIGPIGRWVLHEACRQAREWQQRHPGGAGMSVAVNVSMRQIEQMGFVDTVTSVLSGTGLSPGHLIMEITETVLAHDSPRVIETLKVLHRLGVRFAIDDFGTGYSSLRRLSGLPIDIVKIDRSFVRQMTKGRTAIVTAAVNLAHDLGLRCIAEGIEDDHQLRLLRDLGCDEGQGFLLGRPGDVGDIDALLDSPAPVHDVV